MKTVIVYSSKHHGNTKKLADAIAQRSGAYLIDADSSRTADLAEYELIGFASGIAYAKYYPQLLQFMENNLPHGKNVFFIHTAGSPRENQNAEAKAIADARDCKCFGTYFCKGFDTYGPFKYIGGIAKGHPTRNEIEEAIKFYNDIVSWISISGQPAEIGGAD